MSGCKISINDLYYQIYTLLINGKVPFSRVRELLLKLLNCSESDPEYKNTVEKAKDLYDNEFMSDDVGDINISRVSYCLFKLHGTNEPIEKEEVIDDLSNIFHNVDKQDIEQIADKIIDKFNQSYISEVTDKVVQIIDRNLQYDNPDESFMALTLNDIKAYIRSKNLFPGKNRTKQQYFTYLKKLSESSSVKPSPPSPREKPQSYGILQKFDVCKSREYPKPVIEEYIAAKGWSLKTKTNSKEQLCEFIQKKLKEEEIPQAVTPPKIPTTFKKVSQLPPLPSTRKAYEIEELEEEEEEEEQKIEKCGQFESYNSQNEFFICSENEVCDVDNELCVDKNREIYNDEYKSVSLEKDGKKQVFIGTVPKLKGLKQKYTSISKTKQEERRRLEEEKIEKERQQKKKEKERATPESIMNKIEELYKEGDISMSDETYSIYKALKKQMKVDKEMALEIIDNWKRDKEADIERKRQERKVLRKKREEEERIQREEEEKRTQELKEKEERKALRRKKREEEERRQREQEEREEREEEERKQAEKERREEEEMRKEIERQIREQEIREKKILKEQEQQRKEEEEQKRKKREKKVPVKEITEEDEFDISALIPSETIKTDFSKIAEEFRGISKKPEKYEEEEEEKKVEKKEFKPFPTPSTLKPAVRPVTSTIDARKLIPRKISSITSLKKDVEKEMKKEEEEEKVVEKVEEEDEQAEKEEEIETDKVAIDFERLQDTLKNILKQGDKQLGKELLSIPKKISYCVGLRV
jgi:hypothetical protein